MGLRPRTTCTHVGEIACSATRAELCSRAIATNLPTPCRWSAVRFVIPRSPFKAHIDVLPPVQDAEALEARAALAQQYQACMQLELQGSRT